MKNEITGKTAMINIVFTSEGAMSKYQPLSKSVNSPLKGIKLSTEYDKSAFVSNKITPVLINAVKKTYFMITDVRSDSVGIPIVSISDWFKFLRA